MIVELYLELIDKGIPAHDANTLVCIVHHESKFKPEAINHSNRNKTKDYGLFQINTIWKKICGFTGKELLVAKNNIKCAIHVYNKQGLTAWATYPKCKGK